MIHLVVFILQLPRYSASVLVTPAKERASASVSAALSVVLVTCDLCNVIFH